MSDLHEKPQSEFPTLQRVDLVGVYHLPSFTTRAAEPLLVGGAGGVGVDPMELYNLPACATGAAEPLLVGGAGGVGVAEGGPLLTATRSPGIVR